MHTDILVSLGKIAGIAGISVGFVLLIFKGIIRKNIFSSLTKKQSFEILRLIIILSFTIGILGIVGWFYSNSQNTVMHHEIEHKQVVAFKPIENLEEKINSFDLNPLHPKITLRFRSNKWKILTSFEVSKKTVLSDLKTTLIDHFDLRNSVDFDLSAWQTSSVEMTPVWVIKINEKEYDFQEDYQSLENIGAKNNDLLTFKISWLVTVTASYDTSENDQTIPVLPEDINL